MAVKTYIAAHELQAYALVVHRLPAPGVRNSGSSAASIECGIREGEVQSVGRHTMADLASKQPGWGFLSGQIMPLMQN